MGRKYILPVCLLFMIWFILAGCRREEFIWGTKVGDITYSEEVALLGNDEIEMLSVVSENEIEFSGTTAGIDKLTDLNYLIAGITDKTPFGLLRKITGIRNDGNSIIITTTDAVLTDIIKEGIITLQLKLQEKNFTLKSKMDGVLVTGPGKAFEGLAITLENFEIFRDGTRIGILNGSIGISPEIDLTIKIGANRINEINLGTTLNKIDELTLSANGALSGTHEIVAAEFVHSPIIIDSLVFVPEVRIICGFDGSVSGGVTSGVRQDRVVTSVIKYSGSNWSEDPLANTESHDFTMPLISENSDLKIFSGPEVTLRLFGIPLQTIKATGYYKLEARKTESPLWKLFIGGDGQNSISPYILGLNEGYVSNLTIQASEIANANSGRK